MPDSKIENLKGRIRKKVFTLITIVDLIDSAVDHEQWGALAYNLGRLGEEYGGLCVLLEKARKEAKLS